MGRKDSLVYQLAAGQSLATSFNSPVTVINYLDNVSYQINTTTSDSVGSFFVQASNDYQKQSSTGQVINAGTWVDLTLGGGTPSVSAANDQILIYLNQMPFTALRLRYASATPGTGTCDIFINAKQIGG